MTDKEETEEPTCKRRTEEIGMRERFPRVYPSTKIYDSYIVTQDFPGPGPKPFTP